MDDQAPDPDGTAPNASAAASPGAASGSSPETAPRVSEGWHSATVGGQWPATVADTIEGVVSAFRLQVIRPLMLVARGLVFGIIVATMALVMSVLVAVALVRVLTVYLFDGRVWASYLLLGVVFSASGTVAWTKRHSPGEDSAEAA
ncbi:MAG TPA: hypothetical protein VED63_11120 [Acidimicrobiales bacterium]|nr:hypothetical protein [Acidimicrobiales bacterium]